MFVMRWSGALVLLACAWSGHARSLVMEAASGNDVDADLTAARSWLSIGRCAVAGSPLDCVEARSRAAVEAMLAQMSEARAARDEAALEPEVVDKVSELSEVMVEAAATILDRKMGFGQREDDGELVGEGRGKKKKKIHKLIALVKLVLLVLVVKLKLAFLMMALQTLFQFKMMVMVLLILMTKKIALWAQLKAAKSGQDAQKVIYYEHAQHQHHYDDHGGWGGGHDEHAESGGGGGGGWGGLWGRSYETATADSGSGTGTGTGTGVLSGVYRAADGTRIIVRPPDSHDMAYSAQRP